MTGDVTFITNEAGNKLEDRFAYLIQDSKLFDCLVGYFYSSGFKALYKSLEDTEKIRILIGISTDKEIFSLIKTGNETTQTKLRLASKQTKDNFTERVTEEMENSDDSFEVEESVFKFIEWIVSGKLDVRVYPVEAIHSKLYIMSFKDGDRDTGRVITGSSNFTKSGLNNNLEFNVELKNKADYEFALKKFNQLWEKSIPVSEEYIQTVKTKTWLNDEITPFELYLKFLYEYFRDKVNLDKNELSSPYLPSGFMDLQYQKDAVMDAKAKLEEYGGVFISDVVGLGKTYIATMLAHELDGRCLVIAPPVLIDRDNPGSWPRAFEEFGVRQSYFESRGKLDKIIERGTDGYSTVIIDEAHSFRNEETISYEKLSQICRGKRVILVTATPLNNTPSDLLSLIKLFQNGKKSTLPNPKVRNLESYFGSLEAKLKGLDRKTDKDEYIRVVRENAEDIRENVLKYLMVRRTRSNIEKYYSKDLKLQGLKFPKVSDPEQVIYHFDDKTDVIFNDTLDLIVNKFTFSRYTPFLYLKNPLSALEKQSQRNMRGFMKVLLLKRLESSIFSFKKSISRFIVSYERFIKEYDEGNVYVSKKHINKIFDLIENDDDDAIQKLLDEEKASKHSSCDFTDEFIKDLKYDLKILTLIHERWAEVKTDPKLEEFVDKLKSDKVLKESKLIVFTESKETAQYLESKLNPIFDNKVMEFSSDSNESKRKSIIDNFDAKAREQKDDVRILISTEILSEGVNLNRSNIVINYDIPWNPTRMMQRVGRINRVDSKFEKIYTYNFFPAGPINENIGLEEAAEAKIEAFIEMLGNDAKLLTDEEIKSHDLFKRLSSKESLTGEEEDDDIELKCLIYLREIRDNDIGLFAKVKSLPKKSRTGRKYEEDSNSTVTFLQKGKVKKIFKADYDDGNIVSTEIDFGKAVEILEVDKHTDKEKVEPAFYQQLEANKKLFEDVFIVECEPVKPTGNRGNEAKLRKIIKAIIRTPEFTDDQEEYLNDVLSLLDDGALPKATLKKIIQELKDKTDVFVIFRIIAKNISQEFFKTTYVTSLTEIKGKEEVILSEYLISSEGDD